MISDTEVLRIATECGMKSDGTGVYRIDLSHLRKFAKMLHRPPLRQVMAKKLDKDTVNHVAQTIAIRMLADIPSLLTPPEKLFRIARQVIKAEEL